MTTWFGILLFMFARGSSHPIALTAGICVGLPVHEIGHALVARYLRRGPSIVLHGFGGLTYQEQTARAVEGATLTAMGPAAGLLFALVIGGGALAVLYGHVPFHASRGMVGAWRRSCGRRSRETCSTWCRSGRSTVGTCFGWARRACSLGGGEE